MSDPDTKPEQEKEKSTSEPSAPADGGATNGEPISNSLAEEELLDHQAALPEDQRVHHQQISKILEEVLITPEPTEQVREKAHRHHLWLDFALGFGLLLAMAGFSIGLTKTYTIHKAQQCIMQRNYKAAIAMLQDTPIPQVFNSEAEPKDLLNEALYLDAMEKLDVNVEDKNAVKELEKIQPGSRFFTLAQQVLQEHFHPSSVQLQTKIHNDASTVEQVIPKPIVEPDKE